MWSTLGRKHVGIPVFQGQLRKLLVDKTHREFPNVKYEIDKRLLDCKQMLKSLQPVQKIDDQQPTFLLYFAAKFQKITSHAFNAHYSRSLQFEYTLFLWLATQIIDLNTIFLDDV